MIHSFSFMGEQLHCCILSTCSGLLDSNNLLAGGIGTFSYNFVGIDTLEKPHYDQIRAE